MASRQVSLFSCQLRLAGNINHSVPILNATERELVLLRRMHGDDAVVEPKEVGKTEMDERIELFRLARKYANTADAMSGRDRVARLLHVEMFGYEQWLDQQTQEEELNREIRREADAKDIAEFTRKQLQDKAARAAVEARV